MMIDRRTLIGSGMATAALALIGVDRLMAAAPEKFAVSFTDAEWQKRL